jgi:Cellulase (glycosyl hydrolase family 5)
VRRLAILAGLAIAFAATLFGPSSADASPYIRYGVQDDAWLEYGPGTLDDRLDELDSLGVDVVRVTIDWRATEPRRGVDDWTRADLLLNGLHDRGIAPLVTLFGTPAWANGGRSENWVPTSKSTFAGFARRVAQRYPFVHLWTIWNEPNQRRSLRPTSPKTYVQQLLNPAFAAIHAASPGSLVAGGVTAPRGSTGGVSPVDWITGMAAAHARLDAYAHNPYPLSAGETPTSGGCEHCTTITMATLPRLINDVQKAFGTKTRIWLTEYGYQTNPPDRLLGVSYATQAKYEGEAALRAYQAPRVDLLIHFLVRDEPDQARWQSGLFTTADAAKPSLQAYRFPLTESSRVGKRTVLWGQVRPGGSNTYRLLRFANGAWQPVGADRQTTARGYFSVAVNATAGARYRIWVPSAGAYSAILTVS